MIGLDTNVIVRYVSQDDATQSPKATKLIESLTVEKPGFIAMITLIELVWVIQSCYHASKDGIEKLLESLLKTQELRIENTELVWQALRQYRKTANADFPDCLIERCGHAAGCSHTVTFDIKAVRAAGMKGIG